MSVATLPSRKRNAKTAKPLTRTDAMFRGEEKSVWRLYEHGVTSSLLSSYLLCREQTYLHYVKGYGAPISPIALEYGSCIHWVLEQAYGNPKRLPTDDNIHVWLRCYEAKWRAENRRQTAAQAEMMEKVYGMASCVLPHYFKRWSGDFTGNYGKFKPGTKRPAKWLSLEQEFAVPYTYPDGKVVTIRGKRDGVFLDPRGKVYVFDTKCLSVVNEADIVATLPLDLQFMLYLWVTREELKKMPAGITMNIPRRPGQHWLVQDTLQSFLERVQKDVSNAKRYDHYFIRFDMDITKGELDWWKRNQLDPIMLDLRLWWDGVTPHYMNPKNLVTKYGRCGMFDAITAHDTSGLEQRTRPFSELSDA
jgi:hypothetical protein